MNWQQAHANAAAKAITHRLVEEAIEEYLANLHLTDSGLVGYGLRKIATYAAQVARAEALGFDPELLTLSDDAAEVDELLPIAEAAVLGVPVDLVKIGHGPQVIEHTEAVYPEFVWFEPGGGRYIAESARTADAEPIMQREVRRVTLVVAGVHQHGLLSVLEQGAVPQTELPQIVTHGPWHAVDPRGGIRG